MGFRELVRTFLVEELEIVLRGMYVVSGSCAGRGGWMRSNIRCDIEMLRQGRDMR